MEVKDVVCYSNSLNIQDAMAHLRIVGPFRQAGINVMNGMESGKSPSQRGSMGDVVIFQREFPGKFVDYQKIVDAARLDGKPIVFDLDDLLFFLPESHPDRQSNYYSSSLLPMFQALSEADLVTVSTLKLQSVVANYNNHVTVLPNYFDETLWQLRPPVSKQKGELVTIGFMGGNSHLPDIEYVLPVLQNLMKRYPHQIKFCFWGLQPPAEILSLPLVEWKPTSIHSYKDFSAFFQTQNADIFIAPLAVTLFNRCKSPLKFFEYSALGAPSVLSRLEPYADVVTHGQNGFLASSLDEWTDCLIQLIENDELRIRLASNAQSTIRKDWLLSQNAFRWRDIFQSLSIGAPRHLLNQEGVVQSINIQLTDAFDKKDALITEKERAMQTLAAKKNLVEKELLAEKQSEQVLSTRLAEKELLFNNLSFQLAEINRSKAWKIAIMLRRIRLAIAPPNSRSAIVLRRMINIYLVPLINIKKNLDLKNDCKLIRASGLYDEAWYLTTNPDVAILKVDPLLHYLRYGAFEGRDPGPSFSSTWYLKNYEDVKNIGINPLLHYVKYGMQEGRSKAAQPVIIESPAKIRSEYVSIAEEDIDPKTLDMKLIAFYLPQFHPIPENDEWWGKGFTEWTNVSKATPNFKGHYQPHLPGELGFYDLRIPEVQQRQIELARKYGIYGFCFHYYWFNGKRLLERPLNQFLKNPDLDFPFCVCWANENWTRRWDGLENEILIEQKHTEEESLAFIRDIIPNFLDKRYIRVNGKPLLIVYRVSLMPDPKQVVKIWRSECKKKGIEDIYLVAAQSFGIADPRSYGFDAAVEFPPHNLWKTQVDRNRVQVTNPNFTGIIFDYGKAVQKMKEMNVPNYTLFRTVMPAWDNTPRKQNDGFAYINSTPSAYKAWLEYTISYTKRSLPEDKRFIFINSWNEWGEGAYLEPDRKYGYAYLQATADAILANPGQLSISDSNWMILFISHDAIRGGAQTVLLNTIMWFKEHTSISLKVLCMESGEWLSRFKELADSVVLDDLRDSAIGNTDVDLVNQLVNFCGGTPDLIYGNTVAAGKDYKWLNKLGVPILTHVHELESSIKHYAGEWIEDITKHSTHYIAGSAAVRDNLVNNHSVSPENISLCYASINPANPSVSLSKDEKDKLKKRLDLDQKKFIIFGCGLGMPFRKGADLFIELGRILQREGIDNFHLYWIGDFEQPYNDSKYGSWSDHLDRLQKSKLSSNVTFLGTKENPRDYFLAGEVFVLTSREEPFGLVALEAADSRLPVICFENAGVADFVGKDAGFVVPCEDIEAMAGKVISLIKDDNLREVLGEQAREKLLSSFTVERTTPQVLAVCRQVAQKKPGVSVIVPNYNHAQYLPQRLESIFNQIYQDFEVILLDDASSDNSLDVLEKYKERVDVRILRNAHNSGSPFKQWLKGIDLARAEIIWVAESDDLSAPEFLKALLPAFNDPKVKLAYANSHIIDENGTLVGDYLSSPYLASLSLIKWQTNYKVPAVQEINDGLGVKDTILNASAVLFRKFDFDKDFRDTFSSMSIAGDWYFVVHAIKDGMIQYDARKLNYHRRHSESVIGKILQGKKLERFFQEFSMVQKYVFITYQLAPEFYGKWETYLRQQWNDFYPNRSFDDLSNYYPFDELKKMILDVRVQSKNSI